MEWRDDGIVLSTRPYGETGAIVELLTREHGRHLGLVRGGAGRRHKGMLQPGNGLAVHWRARLSEHLGSYTAETVKPRAGVLMDDSFALTGLSAACAVAGLVPEREAHPALYEGFELLLDTMEDADIWPAVFVRFELGLLQELGFGLDLAQCAATGSRDDLAYVSPRSGGAVSRSAGEAYRDRLFRLPQFLIGAQAGKANPEDIAEGLRITGHFLERHLYAPQDRHLPDARIRLMERFAARAV
ncbi:MAG: DNA repair protein RecO [Parvibaculum sp.]|jgi:DNA repair protein RecO (recombination protein O)|uniref:DNA repair protein RecO n=1 Tax=Parvibaculum sp. TaxID=2024848 RepID=UPI00284B77BC|nr:DNA repair protein RecO [Parvibaculum sp.]MDR3499969.1 DNA repair protein RecO [Parvibaculum sp.]